MSEHLDVQSGEILVTVDTASWQHGSHLTIHRLTYYSELAFFALLPSVPPSPRHPRSEALRTIRPLQANRVAVHHAAQMHQRNSQIARQNSMLQQMNRNRLLHLAQQVAETPATLEEYQQLAEVAQEVQGEQLEPAQLASRIEGGPFNWLITLLPDNKDQAYQFVSMLVTILAAVIAILTSQRTPQPTQTITPEQVEHIIERVAEQIEHDQHPEPPTTTTAPECEKKP
jgi:hypothetical protein